MPGTLIDERGLQARAVVAAPGGPLGPLFDSLAAELEPLIERGPSMPPEKALLTRAGGRCPDDGSVLDFDPFSPREHRCPRCGNAWREVHHYRAWITWYQLWLAERALQAALFHRLRGDRRHLDLAAGILGAYADRYLEYPNVDNVLGPSRLFFSTYLESIWLQQLCIAAELLSPVAPRGLLDRLRERVVEPARGMIAEFDEALSNRQVWNNAALMSAASLCGDGRAFAALVEGRSGLMALLSDALLEDGSWYEGENYHQFALRGLWYAVTRAEQGAAALPAHLRARFHRAFAIPFATALPDFTMPSRKDSQYATSLRQWRLAELTELGFARTNDPVLRRALSRCYEPGHPQRDTDRSRSAADAERNAPSGALTRADLGWRALLFATPELAEVVEGAPRSVNLNAQGYAVFRRDPDVYVGFEHGQSGGGHGHPDRLNLTLYQGSTRWLDDLGTGSYVERSLHWYRSTLAHNAPLVNGRSQELKDGVLGAYDEREGMGWVEARFDANDGVVLRRAIAVSTDYLIDELSWTAGSEGTFVDLPIHLEGTLDQALTPSALTGSGGLEDGFDFVRDARSADVAAGQALQIDCSRDGRALVAHVGSTIAATIVECTAPGQPFATTRRFFVIRARAASGRIRTILSWGSPLAVRQEGDAVELAYESGERHRHRRDDSGWHVELHAGGARSSIDLSGSVPPPPRSAASEEPIVVHELRRDAPLQFELGRRHYRRSEPSWEECGEPSASISIARETSALIVVARVRAGDPVFASSHATNDFDNEHPDTMAAGIQLYLRMGRRDGAWSLVPGSGDSVRVREVGSAAFPPPVARWEARRDGYEVAARVPLPAEAIGGESFQMDVYINETVRGRTRRRGQLVLSGAAGGWVYLRGDRHDDNRWLTLRLA